MKTTKQMAILAVMVLFTTLAVPVASPGMTSARSEGQRILSSGPHQPPKTTPHVGGQIPACPSGGVCN